MHHNIKTDADFARFLGIKPQTLSTWYARNSFDYELLYAKCDVDANFLLTGEGVVSKKEKEVGKDLNSKLELVPLIPIDAMAGYGKGDMSVMYHEAEKFLIPEFGNKMDFLIRITGTSMNPKYFNGDLIGCKVIPINTFLQWGKVYVLDTVQGALCKRVWPSKRKGFIICRSDNAEMYPDFEISWNDVRALALVVGLIRRES